MIYTRKLLEVVVKNGYNWLFSKMTGHELKRLLTEHAEMAEELETISRSLEMGCPVNSLRIDKLLDRINKEA